MPRIIWGATSPTYNDAVEEALCFGWIDSRINPVGDAFYHADVHTAAAEERLRRHPSSLMVRVPKNSFDGLPSECSQHDFGEVWVTYQDGTEAKVHVFASRLKYSRWVEVSLVPDERVETLVRALVEHLAAFGGIPLVAVFDRPKTIALKWGRDGVVTDWNPTFAGVALDLGIGVEVCWQYRPQEKGSVENLVGWVKNSFFKQRRFLDRADLERQLREWLTEANTIRPSRATGVPPSARIAEDRARLRPLRIAPADLALRIPVSVNPTGVVIHDAHPYSKRRAWTRPSTAVSTRRVGGRS